MKTVRHTTGLQRLTSLMSLTLKDHQQRVTSYPGVGLKSDQSRENTQMHSPTSPFNPSVLRGS